MSAVSQTFKFLLAKGDPVPVNHILHSIAELDL